MPLVAIAGSQRVESWQLTDAEWLELKGSYKSGGLVMSCGQPGYPKTSPIGTKFFAHKSGSGCLLHEGGPETQIHLRAKSIVAEAARVSGWTATVEHAAPDRSWIADVMIEKDGRRIAVEVQWSSQTDPDFRRRQRRYEADGLECLWLIGPSNRKNVAGVPFYEFGGTAEKLTIDLPAEFNGARSSLELAEGFRRVLNGDLSSYVEAITSGVEIVTVMRRCWSPVCGKWLSLWYIPIVHLESRCGQSATVSISGGYGPWQPSRLEQSVQPTVLSAMRNADVAEPAYFDRRFSKIKNAFYVGQVCPHCNSIQGDGHIGSTWDWATYTIPMRVRQKLAQRLIQSPHLCIDAGNGRCREIEPEAGAEFPNETESLWFLGPREANSSVRTLPERTRR